MWVRWEESHLERRAELLALRHRLTLDDEDEERECRRRSSSGVTVTVSSVHSRVSTVHCSVPSGCWPMAVGSRAAAAAEEQW